MLEVKNLVKRYGSKYAVNDISFTVERGEIVGFLGPNGAGKSTTMNIVTGYLSSTSGTASIDGHEILEDPIAAKSCIGYHFQRILPTLFRSGTVQVAVYGTGFYCRILHASALLDLVFENTLVVAFLLFQNPLRFPDGGTCGTSGLSLCFRFHGNWDFWVNKYPRNRHPRAR